MFAFPGLIAKLSVKVELDSL